MKSIIVLLAFVLFADVPCRALAGQPQARKAVADSAKVPEGWDTPLGKESRLTAYDAARHIFADADHNESGEFVIKHEKALRIPGTTKERSVMPEGAKLEAPTSRVVRSQGKRYVLLMWDGTRPEGYSDRVFGENVSVLGIFPEGSAEPTDVAEVKSDQFTFFEDAPLITLGEDDAFTIVNHHANSGQPYDMYSLYHIRDGRLRRITDVFTLADMGGCAKSFREEIHWRTEPGEHPEHPALVLSAELIHAPAEFQDGCDRKSAEKREKFEDTYRWENGQSRYIRSGGNVNRLDSWNEKHM